MSDFLRYLKSQLGKFLLLAFLIALQLVVCLMFDVPLVAVWILFGTSLFVLICIIGLGYLSFLRKLEEIRFQDAESIENFEYKTVNPIEQELYERLRTELLERNKEIAETERKFNEATEYFTMWMHQIKTPISGISLIAQNIEDESISNDLKGEITDVNDYVDMVLNYLRLGSESKDIVFEKVSIDDVIKKQLKKFSNHFFAKDIGIDYVPGNCVVLTDEKWISFVIGQLLSNALKYSQSGTITVSCENNVFRIKDQGIGIASEDLPRVFEKGYTGYNGRINSKSTGIGLYLVKQVCDMINVGIKIKSELGKGTEVLLEFSSEEIDGRD